MCEGEAPVRIVIDTNVVVSGIFFGGAPRQVIEAVLNRRADAFASVEIITEYQRVILEMIEGKHGRLNVDLMSPIVAAMHIIEPQSKVEISRDRDDDKFLACAKDAKCMYVVSGDKDLLVLERFESVEIITAREFCDRHLC